MLNPKFQFQIHMGIVFFLFLVFITNYQLFAQEITILYTGESHAMLYPCSCPKEPDGGLSRRATLIKELRKENPSLLLLDSGGFFAGGLMDNYTQNTELDKTRTLIELKGMELMGYDAVAIGDDEFNFGREFFEEAVAKTRLAFLSCNLQSEKIARYLIRQVGGVKFGIIGITNLLSQDKAGGLKFSEPKLSVKLAIEEAKKQGAEFVILLSHLGEEESVGLLKELKGIDILIIGHSRAKEEIYSRIDSTLVLRPSWQTRRLGKVSLNIKDKKLSDYKVEELRLSDKITDNAEILAVLPRCFSDNNCRKEGLLGNCQDPGTLQSKCVFTEPTTVSLSVITSRDCLVCNSEEVIKMLKGFFPGLIVSYLYYPDRQAKKMVEDFALKGLPAYFLGKEVEKESNFDTFKKNLEEKGDFYLLKPEFVGISYFLQRERIKGALDLFISLSDANAAKLLLIIKDFSPTLHFLVSESEGRFSAAGGIPEIEESLRSVCVQKYYPQLFWEYIICRANNIQSSWWEDCLKEGQDREKIKSCAHSNEGKALLRENIALNKELEIMRGPTYLMDNQEIFGIAGVLTKEDFKKILRR